MLSFIKIIELTLNKTNCLIFSYRGSTVDNWQSVAERINELEKITNPAQASNKNYTFLDPLKKTRVSNPTLKVIQKNAVHSYFQRQQASVRESISRSDTSKMHSQTRPKSLNFDTNSKRASQRSSVSGYEMSANHETMDNKTSLSVNHLNFILNKTNDTHSSVPVSHIDSPPRPPPRNRQSLPVRRTSSASEYSSIRDKMLTSKQHLSKDLLGPMILGSVISIDDWVPERPPKNPALRIPSPELPPPPAVNENMHEISSYLDEPLPLPPEEVIQGSGLVSDKNKKTLMSPNRRNSFAGQTQRPMYRASGIENLTSMPPAVPKKPLDINKRFMKKTQEHVELVAKEKMLMSQEILQTQHKVPLKTSEFRTSVRKRPHNMQNTLGIPIIQEKSTPPVPPLKPRVSSVRYVKFFLFLFLRFLLFILNFHIIFDTKLFKDFVTNCNFFLIFKNCKQNFLQLYLGPKTRLLDSYLEKSKHSL